MNKLDPRVYTLRYLIRNLTVLGLKSAKQIWNQNDQEDDIDYAERIGLIREQKKQLLG